MQTFHYYFDVNGAPIFQNTLFRGVQTFIVILMCRVHKYVQNTLFRGVSKLIHYFDANGAQIFQNTLFRGVQTFIIILMCRVRTYFRVLYLGGCKHSLLF